MEIEIKNATGIEVSKNGASVSRAEVRNRGLVAVGRRLLEARAAGDARPLNATEQRAVELAAATPAKAATARPPEERAAPVTPPVDKRVAAMERFRAERKAEKRDMAYEEKLEAIWYALYDLLGSPWDSEAPWSIEATFDDRVIVERQPGQYQAYPISFDAANALTIGAPSSVVVQYVPVAADDSGARALELANLEFGI